jgi:hypothetical protein
MTMSRRRVPRRGGYKKAPSIEEIDSSENSSSDKEEEGERKRTTVFQMDIEEEAK